MEHQLKRCGWCVGDPLYEAYHDLEWGVPVYDDLTLFEFLILETFQAGLSWITILRKRENFRNAFEGFDYTKIANYDATKFDSLLINKGIIRNKLKINAVIYNAQSVIEIKKEYGTFKNWLDIESPKPKEDWVCLLKKRFKFVGGEIVAEFLMSLGYLEGAHHKDCEVYKDIVKSKPKWLEI